MKRDSKIIEFLRLIRPEQWVKNTFVFLPIFFGGQFYNVIAWRECIFAFIAFSLCASSIYCFNDIFDVNEDREHPHKRYRPIASGVISKLGGYFIMALCFISSLSVIYFFINNRYESLLIIMSYFLINIFYTIILKNYTIIDVLIISLGFVLRVFIGGVTSGIILSHWIILMTFLLSLFLAFAKRRDDIVIFEEFGIKSRKNLGQYNLTFLNQSLSIIATITIVCYIMYTMSEEVITRLGSKYIYLTVIFVIAGILRYLQISVVDLKSGSPTKVLIKDRFIQCCLIMWVISFYLIIYIK